MNCPKCGVQLRKLEQRWSATMTNMLERHVICDVERNGCGYCFWYEKQYTSITRNMATKQIITMTKSEPRLAVIHAGVHGAKEITPCDCPDCLDPKELGWHKDKADCQK